jgi:hypothetical protein
MLYAVPLFHIQAMLYLPKMYTLKKETNQLKYIKRGIQAIKTYQNQDKYNNFLLPELNKEHILNIFAFFGRSN